MGEAERSIAIKRRIVAPRKAHREDSPSEVYTPKRKKSSGDTEPSPPPYIPSRKDTSSTGVRIASSVASQRNSDQRRHEYSTNSRSEHTRQTLSSKDRHDLISRSRRMELFKHIGIDRKEGPVIRGRGSSSYVKDSRQSPKRVDTSRTVADHDQPVKISKTSTREVSGRRRDVGDDDGVKDLKIKARLGPAVGTSSSDSRKTLHAVSDRATVGLDLRDKMIRSTYDKNDSLQIVVNPMMSPALKGSVASRLGKIVVKRLELDGNNEDSKDTCEVNEKGRKAVSTHAKSLVNKQCREAVLSVSAGGRRRRRSVSPDSRRVEAADEEEGDEAEDDDIVVVRSGIVAKDENVSVTVMQSVKEVIRRDLDDVSKADEKHGEDDEKDSEDLAEMIGEKLEPELLNDTVQDELNLDLESEKYQEDADDIETMIGVKSEEDKPKPGTRFIVTLDGVDERQLYADGDNSGGKDRDSSFTQPQPIVVNPMQKILPPAPLYTPQLKDVPPPSQHLALPVGMPVQTNISPPGIVPRAHAAPFSPIAYNVGDSHQPPPPVVAGVPLQGELSINKPLPPKIQPFSINLKDSDEEYEDKESRMQLMPSASSSYISQTRPTQSSTSLTSLTALQKAKMSERCKFWPACAAGSECEFHHPTSYCKTFPNCKFADKCLFIHPNCKFDSRCTRQDCPYTHTSRRLGLSSSSSAVPTIPFHPPKPPPIPVPSSTTICRFYPNCHNPSCTFIHPKPCRFGAACQNPSCLFYHPTSPIIVPNKNKLKWKAESMTTTQPKDVSSSYSTSFSSVIDPASKFRQPVAKVSPMSAATNPSNVH